MPGSVDEEYEQAGDEDEEVAGDEYAEFVDEEEEGAEEMEAEEVVLCRKKRRCQLDDDDDEQADRDMQLLQDACLPVSGAPMPPGDGPPKDADEYLRQVQWERLHCPEVVDVDIEEKPPSQDHPRRKQRGVGGGLLARVNLSEAYMEQGVPYAAEWASCAAAAFLSLREAFDGERAEVPDAGTARLTLPQWRSFVRENRPSTAMLAQQNFTSIHRLVAVAVELLEASAAPPAEEGEEGLVVEDAAGDGSADEDARSARQLLGSAMHALPTQALVDPSAPSTASPSGSEADLAVDPFRAQVVAAAAPEAGFRSLDHFSEWAFAALTALELPLVDDTQFQLQRLRRTCHKLLALGAVEGDEDRGAVVARASVLLVVTMDVFGQR